ncbi:MAG: prolipoprotein diacylglyceryl transferase [Sneathiella sp.]|nr:prolipoprotein diacylglyceryl transferase [Sneathiella sp.]
MKVENLGLLTTDILANFINGELYGRVSDVSWAMVFPNGGPLPRHPSQLYEALLEGALLFVIIFLLKKSKLSDKAGLLTGTFLVGYAITRGFVELFRQPDAHLGFLVGGATMGQLLSIPMVLIGLYFIFRPNRKSA